MSDDERREVAQNMRDGVKSKTEFELLSLNGSSSAIRWLISYVVFGDKKYHSGVDLMNRLADLIEPSCDRDALLALADELEEDACWEVQTPGDTSGAWRLKDTCDRIRKALGVES